MMENAAPRVDDLRVSFRRQRIHMAPMYGVCNVIQISTDGIGPLTAPMPPPPLASAPTTRCCRGAPGGERSHSPVPDFHFLFPLTAFFKVAFWPRRRWRSPHGACARRLRRRRPPTSPLVHVSVGFTEASGGREVLLGNRHHQPAAGANVGAQEKSKSICCEVDRCQAH